MHYHVFMSLEHPLKKECDQVARSIDELHKKYLAYFMGEERQPPLVKRKRLEDTIARLRAEVQRANQSSITFIYRQTEARYQIYKSKWDKKMTEIENGTYAIPIKKPNLPKKRRIE